MSLGDTYRILYELVDESEVEVLNIVPPTSSSSGVDKYRYPRAGTVNASCSLHIAEFRISNGQVGNQLARIIGQAEICFQFIS